MKVFTIFFIFLTVIGGCSNKNYNKNDNNSKKPVNIDNNINNKNLIFYYNIAKRTEIVTNFIKIPKIYRKKVIIVDKTLSPEERVADKYLYIADLTKIDKNGKFQYKILTRKEYEQNLNSKVIIYTTKNCPVCIKLKEYLNSKGINYIDIDVEKNREAQKELIIKAKQNDINIQGVPVIDIDGILIMGFQKERIDKLLK